MSAKSIHTPRQVRVDSQPVKHRLENLIARGTFKKEMSMGLLH